MKIMPARARLIAADEAHISAASVETRPNGWLTAHVLLFNASMQPDAPPSEE